MSRKQPVFNISLLTVPVLLIALFLVVQQPLVTTGAQAPAAPSATVAPIALIKTIVIQGKKVDKAAASQVAVERAGATLGAEPGMMLYAGDGVTTGKDAQLAILFLDEVSEKDNEVLLDVTTKVQLGPLFIRSGRILARVKDKFQVRTARAQWTVSGTEYELAVQADGTNSLRVLKGAVQVEAGTFAPTPMALPKPNNHPSFTKSHHNLFTNELAQGPMSFVAVAEKVIDLDREFILTNSCQQRHVYRVTSPSNLSWFQFKGEDQFAIDGNATRNIKFSIRLDATNVGAGTFDSQIIFPCLDCRNEPGCRIGGFLLPITMKVLGSPTPSPAVAPVVTPTPAPAMAPTPVPTPTFTPTPQNAVTVTRMQDVTLPPAGDLRRAEATPQQVEQTLGWSHELIVAGAPEYSAPSVVPYYQNATEREAAFRAARRSSIINDDRKSKQILAETYIDWGNGAKAEAELKGVEVTILDLPGQLSTLGEARRLMGDLTKAEALIKRALGLDSKLIRAYNALGSVYLDQAKVDLDRKDYAAARASLDKARAEFAKALDVKNPAAQTQPHAQQGQPKGTRAEAVVQANLAEVLLRMGMIARAADDNAGALRELQAAEQAFKLAAKSDPSYPFALTGLGDVYRELATTQETLGNQSRADQYLKRSQDQYDQALLLHPDLAEAYVGLGRVLEETGRKDEALKQYRKAVLMRPELADPHYYYAKALSDVDRQQAAEQARLFLKLEKPSLMAGERAKNAQDVIASRPISGKTAVTGTNR